jgi:histidinol-phosphate aminotransferase
MRDLTELVRPNILNLSPYSSARDDFKGEASIWLDANENPFGELNRYPDPYQQELKKALAEYNGVAPTQLFIGNGSDEVIDLLFRLFVKPGTDKALTFSPTYGMYQVSADINDAELINVPLNSTFQIDLESTEPFLDDPNLKLIFICSPNNPTGNLIEPEAIEVLLNRFQGIVVIDEAYIDFADAPSWNERLGEFENLIIAQTFSKARGLAAARLGIAFANKAIIDLLNKIKPPYNVSTLNQAAGFRAMKNQRELEIQIQSIRSERARLTSELEQLSIVKQIFPSDANFILVEIENASEIYIALTKKGIIVRNRSKLVPNTLRISVGTEIENKLLLSELKQLDK